MTEQQQTVYVIHGPNLNTLGQREPGIYGTTRLDEINSLLCQEGRACNLAVECFQSNHEGAIIDRIQAAADDASTVGMIINPAAFTHYSISIRDALATCVFPVVEVHLTNIYGREQFRRHSVTAEVATGVISGLGPGGYLMALKWLVGRLRD